LFAVGKMANLLADSIDPFSLLERATISRTTGGKVRRIPPVTSVVTSASIIERL